MKGIWAIVKTSGKFIQGLGTLTLGVLVLLTMFLVMAARTPQPAPKVADGSVLVLWPNGQVVEQAKYPDPLEELLPEYQRTPSQTSIHDITDALKRAKDDDRIAALALVTDSMGGVAPSHLHTIAADIRAFKESGKKVYALSTSYSQGAYLLAAEADKVYMHQQGAVLLSGFGSYPMYFKSMLDKIGANVNVFKVGTYKSAVEPFIRDEMSPAAREANAAFLGTLWQQYTASVETARGMEAGSLQAGIENMGDNLRQSSGKFGELAVASGLVDELAARQAWRSALIEEFGPNKSGNSFKQIHYQNYLAATDSGSNAKKDVAVITAQGPIVMGDGPVDVTAAETVVDYIREARNDRKTGAIVLRINSGGGSAFASELIRQELLAAQEQGIKVIASMGPVAASGGYWIAATADEIWAAPSTITGSIGIFGIIPTYENTLAKIGVHADGVGTTPLAGAFDQRRPMSELAKDIVQQAIESGYEEFLSLVAEGRGMTVADVDKVAQGRVWAGVTAKEHGLVDHLGGFDEAVKAAASAAELEEYNLVFYRDHPSEFDQMLADILNSTVGLDSLKGFTSNGLDPVMQQAAALKKELEILASFNDPMGRYAVCFTCDIE
jgi:protease-4